MQEAEEHSGLVVAGIDDRRQYYVVQASHESLNTLRGVSERDFLRKVARWFYHYGGADAVTVVLPNGKAIELDARDAMGDGVDDDFVPSPDERVPHDWSQYLRNLCPFKSHERKLAVLAKLLQGPATLDESWAVLGPLYHALSEKDRGLVLHWGCVWEAEK